MIEISQKDSRPLERFIAAVGDGTIYRRSEAERLGNLRIVLFGDRAERVLALLWPYLSEPKREQARRVFDHCP